MQVRRRRAVPETALFFLGAARGLTAGVRRAVFRELWNSDCNPAFSCSPTRRFHMHGLIYLIGLIVVIMAILSFFGLR
jgi:hypothetical protein